jgi:hypothetical protein
MRSQFRTLPSWVDCLPIKGNAAREFGLKASIVNIRARTRVNIVLHAKKAARRSI